MTQDSTHKLDHDHKHDHDHQSEHDHGDSKAGPCHGHGHHHGDVRTMSRKRLLAVLFLSGTFMIVEAVTGIFTGSLALLADAGHMLGDVAALALANFAFWLSSRPAGPNRTYGYHRSEILAALANSVLLVVISIFVLLEAVQRFSHPPEVQSTTMLAVAVVGMCINIVSIRLLSENSKDSLNTRAAYLEVVSDLLASIGVVIAAIIMMSTGWYLADPLISCVLSVFILIRTWGLLKESIDILMESAPEHVDLEGLNKAILGVENVLAVHDIHVWTITSGMIAMSGHVTITRNTDTEALLDYLKDLLQNDFGITHTTIQLETEKSATKCVDICVPK